MFRGGRGGRGGRQFDRSERPHDKPDGEGNESRGQVDNISGNDLANVQSNEGSD